MAWQSNYTLITAPPDSCRPWWAPRFDDASRTIVSNGGKHVAGQIQVAPETLRRQAEAAVGGTVTHNTYALARYMASEHGSGTVEEKMALALLAINSAKSKKTDVFGLLARRNRWDTAVYGPIHDDYATLTDKCGSAANPYCRWAATTKDPAVQDVLIARFALTGAANSFIRGGYDQYSGAILYDAILSDSSSKGILGQAKQGDYWVGPLANVNPLHVYIYAPVPGVAWDSPRGQALIDRAKSWLRGPSAVQWMAERRATGRSPKWMPDGKKTAVCSRRYFDEPNVQVALGATGVVVLGLGAWAAARRRVDFRHMLKRLT